MRSIPQIRTLLGYTIFLFYIWHLIGCIYLRASPPPGSTTWAPDVAFLNASSVHLYLYGIYWAIRTTAGLQSPGGDPPVNSIASLIAPCLRNYFKDILGSM